MGKRHAQQAQGASQILTLPMLAAAKKLQAVGNSLEELERLPLAVLVKVSMSSARLLRQLQLAERDARGIGSSTPGVGKGTQAHLPAELTMVMLL